MLYKYIGIEGLSKWMVDARNLTFAVRAYRGARVQNLYTFSLFLVLQISIIFEVT